MSIDNRKYVVFISSTYTDLMEERTSVTQAILESKHIPCCMEVFPATNESQWEYIKGEIKQSDYFIAIVGGKYGSIHPNTGQSYTEMEFRFARECGIPSLAFLIDEKIDLTKSKIEIDPEINRKLEVFRDYWIIRSIPTQFPAKYP